MGYTIEISVNVLKEKKITEIEKMISDTAIFYNCNKIYTDSEEDGTLKIPKYHIIIIVNFLDEQIENFDKFVKFIKGYKSTYIECIYNNDKYKLVYASPCYLKNIEKDASQKYKQFINDRNFSPNEFILLQNFMHLL